MGENGILKLLLVETVVFSLAAGILSYLVGHILLAAVFPLISDFFVISGEGIVNGAGAMSQYFLIYLGATVGASVWFMTRAVNEL